MKRRKREPQVLSKREQLDLLRQPKPKAPTGLRNLCLISLMLKTGIKAAELIKIGEQDIDWERGLVKIYESGGAKERYLHIDEVELSLLKSWRRIKPAESLLFFTTLNGEPLKDRYLREMIKRYARKAGIKKDVYPHLLRTTFALEFLHETRDIDLLQEVLGHRDQSTTHNYIRHYFLEYSGIKERTSADQEVFADLINDQEKRKKILNRNHPYITIEVEEEHSQRIAIPAIKCCHCSFILHYQDDCPHCGTTFTTILKHWGKII